MIRDLVDFILSEIQSNEFLTAAVVAAPLSVLTYTARDLPVRVGKFLKRIVTVEVRFNSDMDNYSVIQEFVLKNIVNQHFSRSYLYQAGSYFDSEQGEYTERNKGLSVGYGAHFGFYKGNFVFVYRTYEEAGNTSKFKEYLTVSFLTRSKKQARNFSEDITHHLESNSKPGSIPLRVNNNGYWEGQTYLPKRPVSTVITTGNVGEEVISHIRQFENTEKNYRKIGTPYHVGFLLTGPPGTGKTSLIHAIASELDRTILYLNLGHLNSDENLLQLMQAPMNWRKSILVIEDADAGQADTAKRAPTPEDDEYEDDDKDRSRRARRGLTLSALLNILDGLLTPDGLVCIATTNHPDKLDPALLRTGRFDYHYQLGPLDLPAFERLMNLYEVEITDNLRKQYTPMIGSDVKRFIFQDEKGNSL